MDDFDMHKFNRDNMQHVFNMHVFNMLNIHAFSSDEADFGSNDEVDTFPEGLTQANTLLKKFML